MMINEWIKIVKRFATVPYLFIGSGLSRRYLGLPSWEGLLEHFVQRLSDDKFAYQGYRNRASGDLPLLGTLLEKDFNDRWFGDAAFRTDVLDIYDAVSKGVSPFKAEVAHYIAGFRAYSPDYYDEIASLQSVVENNIAGFITTNYDCLLEDIALKYKVFVGQEQLIFSNLQQIAEIYKIHGSVKEPGSIVLTEEDYGKFEAKSKYLAAKLMTIFMEYPIIFMGYSLGDKNVQTIINSLVECLSVDNIVKLQHRFIFVKYNKQLVNSVKIGTYVPNFGEKMVEMTQVETGNFQLIFDGLKEKQAGLPARIVRFLKEHIYNYSMTSIPSKHVLVNVLDKNIDEEELGFFIGMNKEINGLVGITSEDWYRGILFDDVFMYSADEMLNHGFPQLVISNSNKLPVFKYLAYAKEDHHDVVEKMQIRCFDDLLNSTIKNGRDTKFVGSRSVDGILKLFEKDDDWDFRVLGGLAFLKESEIDVDRMVWFLKEYLHRHPAVLSQNNVNSNEKSNFKRLVRIYDWLKYNEKSFMMPDSSNPTTIKP